MLLLHARIIRALIGQSFDNLLKRHVYEYLVTERDVTYKYPSKMLITVAAIALVAVPYVQAHGSHEQQVVPPDANWATRHMLGESSLKVTYPSFVLLP
jgi:hypothetical protein